MARLRIGTGFERVVVFCLYFKKVRSNASLERYLIVYG
ncbi:hypothetical protein ADIS_0755 [Lunatimonas lonarensis]|uniref:Uncharacterized protein n=1 Tax=Lunatimonas lonarensis TaxID=1232681 RepID=R7ZXW5_9BACT|nr:hypothetical protein ADIS_0755 [Lunatimonas lonarensis]